MLPVCLNFIINEIEIKLLNTRIKETLLTFTRYIKNYYEFYRIVYVNEKLIIKIIAENEKKLLPDTLHHVKTNLTTNNFFLLLFYFFFL